MNALMHESGLGSITAGGAVWDDAKGGWLDPQLVASARAEEMGHVRKRTVYRRVPLSQCWSEIGMGPVSTGWVDTNKGTETNQRYAPGGSQRSLRRTSDQTSLRRRHRWKA